MVGLLLGKSDGDELIIADGLDDGRLDGAMLGTLVGHDEGTSEAGIASGNVSMYSGCIVCAIVSVEYKKWIG